MGKFEPIVCLTERDYFAAHAPPPPKWWLDSWSKNVDDLGEYADVITQWNYAYADSMMRERGK